MFEIAESNIGEQDHESNKDEKEKLSYQSTPLLSEVNNFEEDEHDHEEKAEKDTQKKEEESEEKNKFVFKQPQKSNLVSWSSKPFFSLKLSKEQMDWNVNNIKKKKSILEILEKQNRGLLNITEEVDFCENKKKEKK